MATLTDAVRGNDATSVATLDTKLEIVVLPSQMSTARRSSTGGSDGGLMPITTTVATSA
jgi:hypothetical protein